MSILLWHISSKSVWIGDNYEKLRLTKFATINIAI